MVVRGSEESSVDCQIKRSEDPAQHFIIERNLWQGELRGQRREGVPDKTPSCSSPYPRSIIRILLTRAFNSDKVISAAQSWV